MIRNFHGPWRIQLAAAAIGFKIRCATFLLQDPVVNAATRRYATSTVAPKRNGLRTPAATTVTESTVLAIQATARCAANHRLTTGYVDSVTRSPFLTYFRLTFQGLVLFRTFWSF